MTTKPQLQRSGLRVDSSRPQQAVATFPVVYADWGGGGKFVQNLTVSLDIVSESITVEKGDCRVRSGSTKVTAYVSGHGINAVIVFDYKTDMNMLTARHEAVSSLTQWAGKYLNLIRSGISFASNARVKFSSGEIISSVTISSGNSDFIKMVVEGNRDIALPTLEQEGLSVATAFLTELERYKLPA